MPDRELIWEKYENPIRVATYMGVTESLTLSLITLIMHQNDKFVSITNSYDEMTVCYDEALAPYFTCYKDREEVYTAYILLNTGTLMEEAGLVKKISTKFGDNGVPILYLTTSNNNYILVPEDFTEKANELLTLVEIPTAEN